VSGLALGIDAEAHRGALAANGRACAVLGTGPDVEYPREHRAMQRAIAGRGVILSEYVPGTAPRRWHFPQRNRIMAALGHATIVIEAGPTSGALYTAAIALDLGRTVAAVPGPIDSPESAGANALLQHPDVVLITDTAAALALLTLPPPAVAIPELVGDERLLWDALSTPAPSADALVARTRLPTARCLAALAALHLAGAVHTAHDGSLRRA
jgi:DNA processing protein